MLKIRIIKKKNGERGISLVLQSQKVKNGFLAIKERICFKLKLLAAVPKLLGANPQTVSLKKKKGGQILLSLSWKKKHRRNHFKILRGETKNSIWNAISNYIRNQRFLNPVREKFSNGVNGANKTRKIVKGTVIVSIIALILQLSFSSILFTKANENSLCPVNTDVALAVDTTGSMGEGNKPSQCSWENLEEVPTDFDPYYTYMCVYHQENGLTEEQCLSKNDFTHCKDPVYTPAVLKKIEYFKEAANAFIVNLTSGDQSALISFNNSANLLKNLSNDHSAAKTAIDSLTVQATNGTNIGDAILSASNKLTERGNPKANQVIILLTDGKANQPNGEGYGENQADIDYAISNAQNAANLGQKIYTIGLGTGVNQTMLQNIAALTSGQYYPASQGSQLEGIYNQIYNQISQEPCGSISACLYQDDTPGDEEITGKNPLSGWEMILSGDSNDSATTGKNGCYIFGGLSRGNYTVSLGQNSEKQPFFQTHPQSGSYNLSLLGQGLTNIDFGMADSSLCEPNKIDTPGDCVDEGLRQHAYSYPASFAYCGASTTSAISDPTCNCSYSEWTDGECFADGKVHQTRTNLTDYSYCAADLQRDVDSAACECIEYEFKQCVGDNTSLTTYTYNYPYCVQKDDLTNDSDPDCSSVYDNCEDWVNAGCYTQGKMKQTRICKDQYGNPNPAGKEEQSIDSADCSCQYSAWVDGACSSEGFIKQTRTQTTRFEYCVEPLERTVESQKCVCQYSDWQNAGCASDGYRTQTRTQTSQFDYCTILKRNNPDSSCACQLTETAGWCVNNTQRSYTFSYNFAYCGSKEPELRGDPACNTSICVNGILETGEGCDDANTTSGDGCSSICLIEKVSGAETQTVTSGEASVFNLTISINGDKQVGTDVAIIIWTTNIPATSQVIYDTISHPSLGEPPNYGYAYSTTEDQNKVLIHRVVITGLKPDTKYYYRSVSRGSLAISQEYSFATKETILSKIEETAPETPITIGLAYLPETKESEKPSSKFLASADEKITKELEEGEEINGIKEETAGIAPEKESSVSANEPLEKFDGGGLLATIRNLSLSWKFGLTLLGLVILVTVILQLSEKKKASKA